MYYCPDCGTEFEKPEKHYETHNLTSPPFEVIYYCPSCKGENFFEKSNTHCRCCGVKLRNGHTDYCSATCEKRGKKLWAREVKRRRLLVSNPVNSIIRELEFYNKTHNTNYSYGQYIALIKPKEDIKNAKS